MTVEPVGKDVLLRADPTPGRRARTAGPVAAQERIAEPRPGTPLVEHLDEERSSFGMWLFIISEATLFALLFFAYYYLAQGPERRWLVEEPPTLKFSLPMLGILLLSSVVLHWGEKRVKKGRHGLGRIAVVVTMLLGGAFLVLSYFDYRHGFQHLLPTSNAYGSIFYTIVSLHLAHLLLGLLMLAYVLVLPSPEPNDRPPHKPYHAASMYWHFVDTVWLIIVTLLYVTPHLRN